MTLPILTGLILAVVLIVLFYPLARLCKRPLLMGEEACLDEQKVSLSLEKNALLRTISELEIDYAQEKLSTDDYNRIKLTYEHRLLVLLEPLNRSQKNEFVEEAVSVNRPWGLMLGMGIWIVAGAIGVSTLVHGKISKDQMSAGSSEGSFGEASSGASSDTSSGATGMPDPVKMVARLEARLAANPNDLNGQMMLGRSYMVLDRFEDAKKTWEKVLEIDNRNGTAHASIGEILLRTHAPGDKGIAEQALSHFEKAMISSPQDPSINWGRGVALVQMGRVAEAEEAWVETFRALTPGSQEAEMVKKALEVLRSGKMQ